MSTFRLPARGHRWRRPSGKATRRFVQTSFCPPFRHDCTGRAYYLWRFPLQVNVNCSPNNFTERQPSCLAEGVELLNVVFGKKQRGSFHGWRTYTPREYMSSSGVFNFFDFGAVSLGFVSFEERLQIAFPDARHSAYRDRLQPALGVPAPDCRTTYPEHRLH